MTTITGSVYIDNTGIVKRLSERFADAVWKSWVEQLPPDAQAAVQQLTPEQLLQVREVRRALRPRQTTAGWNNDVAKEASS